MKAAQLLRVLTIHWQQQEAVAGVDHRQLLLQVHALDDESVCNTGVLQHWRGCAAAVTNQPPTSRMTV